MTIKIIINDEEFVLKDRIKFDDMMEICKDSISVDGKIDFKSLLNMNTVKEVLKLAGWNNVDECSDYDVLALTKSEEGKAWFANLVNTSQSSLKVMKIN